MLVSPFAMGTYEADKPIYSNFPMPTASYRRLNVWQLRGQVTNLPGKSGLTASMLSQFDWRLRGGLFVMLFSPFSEPANFSQFPIDCLFADLQVGRSRNVICGAWRIFSCGHGISAVGFSKQGVLIAMENSLTEPLDLFPNAPGNTLCATGTIDDDVGCRTICREALAV